MLTLLLSLAYFSHLLLFWSYTCIWLLLTDRNFDRNEVLKVIKYVGKVQVYLMIPLGCMFHYVYSQLDNQEYLLNYPLFTLYELQQWFSMMLYEDFMFYHIHRLLHWKKLYFIHKLHHTWTKPIPCESIYASYTENVLVNFLPILLSALIVRLNMYYFYVWVLLTTFITLVSHSGGNTQHDLHHKYFNVNYGVSPLFDIIYGTNN